MARHYLAWWNVENLFSVEDDPHRSEKLARTLKNELKGWTSEVLDKKLDRLASIIQQFNQGNGPDILGVCEVENASVLQQLIQKLKPLGRDYQVVHADTQDERGVDVAFIYDQSKYRTQADEVFNHFILRRFATRDLLQVNFYTQADNRRLILIGNHWPSRRGGELESEPYRIIAAETLAYWHERIIQIHGKNQAIIVMGDFNDEPFNRALVEYALSERQLSRVKSTRSQSPYLYNLMWSFMGQGGGTHFFDGVPSMLDQILVNRPLLRDDGGFKVDLKSLEVLQYPEMLTTSGAPKRFGRPSDPPFDGTGYSDHLPIKIELEDPL